MGGQGFLRDPTMVRSIVHKGERYNVLINVLMQAREAPRPLAASVPNYLSSVMTRTMRCAELLRRSSNAPGAPTM